MLYLVKFIDGSQSGLFLLYPNLYIAINRGNIASVWRIFPKI